jgi:hypothetical protein
MIELQDKLSDILDTLGIRYDDLVGNDFTISALVSEHLSYIDVYTTIKKSLLALRMDISHNDILLDVPTVWIKGARYKIHAVVHFVISMGMLEKIYITPLYFVYTSFDGSNQTFVSFYDLMDRVNDDKRLQVIESMGVLSNEDAE